MTQDLRAEIRLLARTIAALAEDERSAGLSAPAPGERR
jgi:hypothetical protein